MQICCLTQTNIIVVQSLIQERDDATRMRTENPNHVTMVVVNPRIWPLGHAANELFKRFVLSRSKECLQNFILEYCGAHKILDAFEL